MNPLELPIALFTFLTIVAVIPAWLYFVDTYASGMPAEPTFLARFSLPAVLLFFLASWLAPGA